MEYFGPRDERSWLERRENRKLTPIGGWDPRMLLLSLDLDLIELRRRILSCREIKIHVQNFGRKALC